MWNIFSRTDGSPKAALPPNQVASTTTEPAKKVKVTVPAPHTNVAVLTFETVPDSSGVPQIRCNPSTCSVCQAIMLCGQHTCVICGALGGGGDEVTAKGAQTWPSYLVRDVKALVDGGEKMQNDAPQTVVVDFLLSDAGSPAEQSQSAGHRALTSANRDESSLLVLCIDMSGSMQCTSCVPELQGAWKKMRDGNKPQKSSSASSFSSAPQDEYVSRLQCMKAAVDSHLQRLRKLSPRKRVCLVTFECGVRVSPASLKTEWKSLGSLNIPRNAHTDEKTLLSLGAQLTGDMFLPLDQCFDDLHSAVMELTPRGSTALGPALAVSLGICSGFTRSEVMLCTDGLANNGVGSMDRGDSPNSFYSNMSAVAKGQCSSVSVIGIKDAECRMEVLGQLADQTGGTVNIVDPLEMVRQLRNIFQNPIVAEDVRVCVYAPPMFVFSEPKTKKSIFGKKAHTETTDAMGKSDAKWRLGMNGRKAVTSLGGVTSDDMLSLALEPAPHITQTARHSMAGRAMPLQAVLDYTRRDGAIVRRMMLVAPRATVYEEEALADVNAIPVSAYTLHSAAHVALQRQYDVSRAILQATHEFLFPICGRAVQREEYGNFLQEAEELDNVLRILLAKKIRGSVISNDEVSRMAYRTKKIPLSRLQAGAKKFAAVKRREISAALQEKVSAFGTVEHEY
eukprot:Rmarinus@m.3332